LVIVHGFGEHSGRYEPFAHALAEHGIGVAAADLWGHGRSGGRRGDVEQVDDYVQHVWRMTNEVFLPESGQAKYALFGHSFGGLVAILWALSNPTNLRRLVIQSPLLEVGFPIPRWKSAAASLLARCWPTFTFPMNLDIGALSHDPAVVQAYRADPLVHNSMSARTYCSILRAQGGAFERVSMLRVPLLMLCGSADRVISVETAQRWFDRLGCEKRSVTFPACYHELHHEAVRGEVLRLIRDWTLEPVNA
jgi:alpha-beta hydrolase superfamily lysophospholipase